VSPPSDFFGRSSLYSRRHASITTFACDRLVNQTTVTVSQLLQSQSPRKKLYDVDVAAIDCTKQRIALWFNGIELGALFEKELNDIKMAATSGYVNRAGSKRSATSVNVGT
jgi:hypothetical protein